jgi:hypothetical protein
MERLEKGVPATRAIQLDMSKSDFYAAGAELAAPAVKFAQRGMQTCPACSLG